MNRTESGYPRVLVVAANALDGTSNTGTTLVSLFRQWPADCLAQLHLDTRDPSPDVCPRFRRIDPQGSPFVRWARRAWPPASGRRSAGLPADPVLRAAPHGGWWRQAPVRLRFAARAWADLAALPLPPGLWDWLAEFRPQVVYSVLGSIQVMRLALLVSQRFQLPIVPHFLDDWPSTQYQSGWLARLPRRVLVRRLQAIMNRAPVGLAISEPMADEYRQAYARPFDVFLNSVDTSGSEEVSPVRLPGPAAQAVYVGGLHLGRWELLRELGLAAQQLTAAGLPLEIVVYAPARDCLAYGRQLTEQAGIRMGGTLASHEMLPVLRGADALLHVESFDAGLQRFTRLSISTKLPQYMSAGRPILAYAPAELASCRHVVQCGSGVVVGTRDPGQLGSALRLLVQDRELGKRLGAAGRQAARERHDVRREQTRFRAVLSRAARAWGPAAGGTHCGEMSDA